MLLFLLLNILYFSIFPVTSDLNCGYKEYKNSITGECQPCHSSCKQCNGPLASNCLVCHGSNVKCYIDNGIFCKPTKYDCSSMTATSTTTKNSIEFPSISGFTILNIILSIFLLFCIFLVAVKGLRKKECHKKPDFEKIAEQSYSKLEEIGPEKTPLIIDEVIDISKSSSRKLESCASNTQKEQTDKTLFTATEFPAENFIVDNLDWDKRKPISSGGFGDVYKCPYSDKDGRYYVAVKKAKEHSHEAFKEGEVMRRVSDHPHIIKLITTRIDNNFILVMPLRKNSLLNFLKTSQNINITSKIRYCQQISSGMSYLMFRQILHCDLKASNILVLNENLIEIGDFGLAQKMNENKKTKGTLTHTAIELLNSNNIINSEATDIWSFGVTIWEIFNESKQDPYEGVMKPVREIPLIEYLSKKHHLQINNYWPPDRCPNLEAIATNMFRCWNHDSRKRPTFQQLWCLFSAMLPESPPLASKHTNSSTFFDTPKLR